MIYYILTFLGGVASGLGLAAWQFTLALDKMKVPPPEVRNPFKWQDDPNYDPLRP